MKKTSTRHHTAADPAVVKRIIKGIAHYMKEFSIHGQLDIDQGDPLLIAGVGKMVDAGFQGADDELRAICWMIEEPILGVTQEAVARVKKYPGYKQVGNALDSYYTGTPQQRQRRPRLPETPESVISALADEVYALESKVGPTRAAHALLKRVEGMHDPQQLINFKRFLDCESKHTLGTTKRSEELLSNIYNEIFDKLEDAGYGLD